MNEIETVKSDRMMLIRLASGPVQLIGPKYELMKFKKQLDDPKNRHIRIECPSHLLTWAPWLEIVSVMPAEIDVIIIQDPDKAPRKTGLALPAGPMPLGRPN